MSYSPCNNHCFDPKHIHAHLLQSRHFAPTFQHLCTERSIVEQPERPIPPAAAFIIFRTMQLWHSWRASHLSAFTMDVPVKCKTMMMSPTGLWTAASKPLVWHYGNNFWMRTWSCGGYRFKVAPPWSALHFYCVFYCYCFETSYFPTGRSPSKVINQVVVTFSSAYIQWGFFLQPVKPPPAGH